MYEYDGRAEVELRGVPLGGTLRGVGTLDSGGGLQMDDAFERAMARRCCSVAGVERAADEQTLHVRLRLPLFGARALEMRRVDDESGEV